MLEEILWFAFIVWAALYEYSFGNPCGCVPITYGVKKNRHPPRKPQLSVIINLHGSRLSLSLSRGLVTYLPAPQTSLDIQVMLVY